MKRNTLPKPALVLLVIGLLMTSLTPIINRYFPLPDFLKGFINGMGLMLEVIALIKIQRSKKNMKCAVVLNDYYSIIRGKFDKVRCLSSLALRRSYKLKGPFQIKDTAVENNPEQ